MTLAARIRQAQRQVEYHRQWRNEPRHRRKLRSWQRKLRIAQKEAEAAGLDPETGEPPVPEPPPPPTPVEEAQARLLLPWQVGPRWTCWAPYGDGAWSAVEIVSTSRVWGRAKRVDPKTGEEAASRRANVRLGRLLRRDPALKGADRPGCRPDELWPSEEPGEDEEGNAKDVTILGEPSRPLTAEARANLLAMIPDDSTTDDW